jgi:arylsulfatase A-like enzyme
MDGRTIFEAAHAGEKAAFQAYIHSKPIFSMNFQSNPGKGHKITQGGIAIWDGDYKLIKCLECSAKPLLFNLRNDPEELNNLINEEPETGQRLSALIMEHLTKANEKIRAEK